MKNNKSGNGGLKESKEDALRYMKILVDTARESFLILDHDFLVISANPIFYQNFSVTPEQTENKFIYDLGNGQWNIPELRRLLEEILPEKKVMRDYEVKHIFKTIGEKTILLNARQIDTSQLIILAMEDITDRKKLEEKLANYATGLEVKVAERTASLVDREKKLTTLFETSPVGIAVLDAERRIVYENSTLENILGMSNESLIRGDYKNRTYLRSDGTPMRPTEDFASARAFKEQRVVHDVETGVVKEDGNAVWLNVSAIPVQFSDWKMVVVSMDITGRKRAEMELIGRVKELEALNKTMVGRELKMVELKKEIENLKTQAKNGNGNENGRQK